MQEEKKMFFFFQLFFFSCKKCKIILLSRRGGPNEYPQSEIFNKNKPKLYTLVEPSFTIHKWGIGLRGFHYTDVLVCCEALCPRTSAFELVVSDMA